MMPSMLISKKGSQQRDVEDIKKKDVKGTFWGRQMSTVARKSQTRSHVDTGYLLDSGAIIIQLRFAHCTAVDSISVSFAPVAAHAYRGPLFITVEASGKLI